jgi:septal ring factor EnvC (AmiA/AmiB activator)
MTNEELAKLVHELEQQKTTLESEVTVLRDKLQALQTALHENDMLREQVSKLFTEYQTVTSDEWKRKSDFFPDILGKVLERSTQAETKK